MFNKAFLITVLLAALNACTNNTTTTISTIPVVPTSTYTLTPQPTVQISITPKPSATLDPFYIAMTVTQQAFNDLNLDFPGMCDSTLSLLKPPNTNWLAQDCPLDSLQIINKDKSTVRKVTYKEIFGGNEGYPNNAGALQPLRWTNDSQYLYFSARDCCWDPGILLLAERSTLYRININNGEYSLIRSGMFDSSFSPTDRRITFIEELVSPPIVEVQDLTTGSLDKVELNVDKKHNQASVDAWSNDGLRFTLSVASGSLYNYNETEETPAKFSVIIIDVNKMSQKLIVKDMETVYLRVLDWSRDDVLTIQTGHPSFTEPIKIWHYDLKTDTLIAPAPNP